MLRPAVFLLGGDGELGGEPDVIQHGQILHADGEKGESRRERQRQQESYLGQGHQGNKQPYADEGKVPQALPQPPA